MECGGKRYITHASRSDTFTVWNLSDLHLLNAACAEKELKCDIKRIAEDPYAFWFGGGDYADFIGYDDGKRFDPDCVSERLKISDLGQLGKKSVEVVYEWLSPIKEKCLGLLLGNHEKRYQCHKQQEDLHGWLCTAMGVQNLRYCAFVDVVFVRNCGRKPPEIVSAAPGDKHCETFRFFLHHGAGFATTPGGKLNRLIQFMTSFDADVYMVGHVHDRTAKRLTALGADATCGALRDRGRVGVISGSYLKCYHEGTTSYGEMRGYTPTSLGASWVQITPNALKAKDRLRAEI